MKKKRIIAVLLALLMLPAFGCRLFDAAQDRYETLITEIRLEKQPPPEILALFPDAVSYDETEIAPSDEPYGGGRFGASFISRTVTVKDGKKNLLGYLIVVTGNDAYNPPLTLALGVTPEGVTTGIYFLEMNESPGMGTKADEPFFKEQFVGRSVESFTLFGEGADGVDAISGATVTSRAVLLAVNAALDYYRGNIQK